MKTINACLANENGSALVVAVLLVPVLTLLCVFASNVGIQNTMVSVSEECRRDAFYDADGGLYGTAKLLALANENVVTGIESGEDKDAPGLAYQNSYGNKAVGFVNDVLVSKVASQSTTEDVQFIIPDFYVAPSNPIHIEAMVDVFRYDTGYSDDGGGAEFSMGADGAGAALQKAVYRIDSQADGPCANSPVGIRGEFHMIAQDGASPKGL